MIVKRYTLSNINGWLHLGTLNSGYNGRCTKLNIICTEGYNPSGSVYKNRYANITFFTTSDVSGTTIKGMCNAVGSTNLPEIIKVMQMVLKYL